MAEESFEEMVKMNPKQFKSLIKKYWEAGMNNAYWYYIEDKVDKDIQEVLRK